MNPTVTYLADVCVDPVLDQEIRGLLTACFTKPQDAVFNQRRYFREPYPNRWLIRDSGGTLIAHAGVHEKQIAVAGSSVRIGGLCEVCVHPDHRGRGHVRALLQAIHRWLIEREFVFGVLFGDPLVYGSSGYVQVANMCLGGGPEGWRAVSALIVELSDVPWPREETVCLPGPDF